MKSTLAILAVALATAVFSPQAAETKPAPSGQSPAASVKNVGIEQFDKLRQNKTNVVLDVRTKKEHSEAHLPGAILIDITEGNFEQEIAKLDKSKTYLVHCAAGGRSARACKKMDQLGFKSLYNMEGGLTAWQKAGKPVETEKK